jgi:hypothetical protein
MEFCVKFFICLNFVIRLYILKLRFSNYNFAWFEFGFEYHIDLESR